MSPCPAPATAAPIALRTHAAAAAAAAGTQGIGAVLCDRNVPALFHSNSPPFGIWYGMSKGKTSWRKWETHTQPQTGKSLEPPQTLERLLCDPGLTVPLTYEPQPILPP